MHSQLKHPWLVQSILDWSIVKPKVDKVGRWRIAHSIAPKKTSLWFLIILHSTPPPRLLHGHNSWSCFSSFFLSIWGFLFALFPLSSLHLQTLVSHLGSSPSDLKLCLDSAVDFQVSVSAFFSLDAFFIPPLLCGPHIQTLPHLGPMTWAFVLFLYSFPNKLA